MECVNGHRVLSENCSDCLGPHVPHCQPNYFGRRPVQEAELAKIVVFRHDDKIMLLGIPPNRQVGLPVQSNIVHVLAFLVQRRERAHQARTQVLIE